ncbi:MAG TPA: nucleotidyltransferase family protein [Gemmatimonadaceae bacterium]|nr:nucleotidyltransferase family protein [Gemmatimonadaceae bacterium]
MRQNEFVWECLQRLAALTLPSWYLGAGCIAQTIWNVAHAKPATVDIADYDIVYFDPDLSAEAESDVARCVHVQLADLPIRLDVKNQARVHLWYEGYFGYKIRAYTSCEDALASWPTTATAVGIRWIDNTLQVYAPFGTDDLFSLTVRPNRVQITPAIYEAKVDRWTKRWSQLKIMSWEQGIGVPGSRWII